MKYEIMVILDPSKTEKEHEKMLDEIKKVFSDGGLAFVEEDVWGLRQLAYKIKGFTSGYYVVMNFEGEGTELPKINKELGLMSQTGLVRYMLQKMPEDYALMRYDRKEESAAKLSEHAEELQKKVTKSATKKTEKTEKPKEEVKEEKEEVAEEKADEKEEKEDKTEKLDEKLQAIINDTDIDL